MNTTLQSRLTASIERSSSWLAWLGTVTLALMTLFSFVDVVGRELISSSIAAKVEMTELMMGLIVFFGLGLITFLRSHIRVDVIIVQLSSRLRATFDVVTYALSIFFVALICWCLGKLAMIKLDRGGFTQIWEIPLWPMTVVMTVCSVVMFAVLIIQWIQAIRIAAGRTAPIDTDPPVGVSTD